MKVCMFLSPREVRCGFQSLTKAIESAFVVSALKATLVLLDQGDCSDLFLLFSSQGILLPHFVFYS